MLTLIQPLLPLLALPILYYGGVVDDFWAHFIALFYMAWWLIDSLPRGWQVRIVLHIAYPVVLLCYAIDSGALSLTTGCILALGWLLFMALVVVLARVPIGD